MEKLSEIAGRMGDENCKLVIDFLIDHNMNSDPDRWKDGYKEFSKYHKMTWKEFDDTLLKLLNYYFLISIDYDGTTDTFKNFILRHF